MTIDEQLTINHVIGGRAVPSRNDATFGVINPADGKNMAVVADGTTADIADAVASAREALEGDWARLAPTERGRLIGRLGTVVLEHADELALIEARENGRLLRDTRAQLRFVSAWFEYFAGLADKVGGDVVPTRGDDAFVFTRREPVGVVGMIVPWNAPMMLLALKLPAALAAGCTAVVKPSEFAPGTITRFAELALEAGLPPGVFNVVQGAGPAAGAALVADPGVSHIAFTGSTEVGRRVAAAAGSRLVGVTLELGGKSPQLVFDDADLDAAAKAIVTGGFSANGQSCFAGTRVYVHESVADDLARRMADILSTVRLGDPQHPSTEVGPVANRPQYDRVQMFLELARNEGATVLASGPSDVPEGLYVTPVLLTDVDADSRLLREEIFGPIVVLSTFADDEEAIRAANDSDFGLAAGVWTQRLDRAHRVSAALEAGTVWVNTYRALSPAVPFGGVKSSGLGRENGLHAMDEFTAVKSVWIQLDEIGRAHV